VITIISIPASSSSTIDQLVKLQPVCFDEQVSESICPIVPVDYEIGEIGVSILTISVLRTMRSAVQKEQ
jgi:hypothetical protein